MKHPVMTQMNHPEETINMQVQTIEPSVNKQKLIFKTSEPYGDDTIIKQTTETKYIRSPTSKTSTDIKLEIHPNSKHKSRMVHI